MPVYYVIYTDVRIPTGWYVYRILKVFETTLEAVTQGDYQADMHAFSVQGLNPMAMIFEREPDNPFRDSKDASLQ